MSINIEVLEKAKTILNQIKSEQQHYLDSPLIHSLQDEFEAQYQIKIKSIEVVLNAIEKQQAEIERLKNINYEAQKRLNILEISTRALSEIKATIDGCIEEINSLPKPPQDKED
jgi:hypothetical protein